MRQFEVQICRNWGSCWNAFSLLVDGRFPRLIGKLTFEIDRTRFPYKLIRYSSTKEIQISLVTNVNRFLQDF